MLGLTLREEFRGRRLKGTAIELANEDHTGATQVGAAEGTVKVAFAERAGTRDRDRSSSRAAIVTASPMRKERLRRFR